MILTKGQILPSEEQPQVIQSLSKQLLETLQKPQTLSTEKVIQACDILAKKVLHGDYDVILAPILSQLNVSHDDFNDAAMLFTKTALEEKIRIELGELQPLQAPVKRSRHPLGVLFHIAAGNVDGLPAYSVLEGLLVGNINLLKLPAGDQGLSIFILHELIQIEPELTDYIYVFDVPSTELASLKQLATFADAVVVWGGDVAVQATKELVDSKTKVIAWGHKISFAYATTYATDEQLTKLAQHICETNQMFCSSCQGIYVDTDSREEQDQFAKQFFHHLEKVNHSYKPIPLDRKARNAIQLYDERLRQHETHHTLYLGQGFSVISKESSDLEGSYLFRNVWVKRLPRHAIIETLKPHKNHLQTVGLCVEQTERDELSHLFIQSGLVRITSPERMSKTILGGAHDGTYPLREYSRIVEIESV